MVESRLMPKDATQAANLAARTIRRLVGSQVMEMLVAHHADGVCQADLARRYKLAQGTVSRRLRRARQILTQLKAWPREWAA